MSASFFISHGSPMIAIESNDYTRFLTELGRQHKPEAIVIFSAHWEEQETTVSFLEGEYETIYDFGGFPDELFQVKYPAKGSPKTAELVEQAMIKHGVPVRRDTTRGLDHGSWTILRHMYPDADIPVVAISVNPNQQPEEQYRIGTALRELQDHNLLILGSGSTVHNLRVLKWDHTGAPESWATEFDDWLIEKIQKQDTEALFDYRAQAPHAAMAVPRAEHFVPVLQVMGSAEPDRKAEVIHRHYDMGSLSYLCLQFG